ASAPIDERTDADVLGFVQAYARQLRFFEGDGEVREAGTWEAFANRADVSLQDVAAYLSDPSGFSGEKARWLGRPHFALVLAYAKLLGRAREHLNGYTRRHLDYHYRDLLRMEPGPAAADRVTVLFAL